MRGSAMIERGSNADREGSYPSKPAVASAARTARGIRSATPISASMAPKFCHSFRRTLRRSTPQRSPRPPRRSQPFPAGQPLGRIVANGGNRSPSEGDCRGASRGLGVFLSSAVTAEHGDRLLCGGDAVDGDGARFRGNRRQGRVEDFALSVRVGPRTAIQTDLPDEGGARQSLLEAVAVELLESCGNSWVDPDRPDSLRVLAIQGMRPFRWLSSRRRLRREELSDRRPRSRCRRAHGSRAAAVSRDAHQIELLKADLGDPERGVEVVVIGEPQGQDVALVDAADDPRAQERRDRRRAHRGRSSSPRGSRPRGRCGGPGAFRRRSIHGAGVGPPQSQAGVGKDADHRLVATSCLGKAVHLLKAEKCGSGGTFSSLSGRLRRRGRP